MLFFPFGHSQPLFYHSTCFWDLWLLTTTCLLMNFVLVSLIQSSLLGFRFVYPTCLPTTSIDCHTGISKSIDRSMTEYSPQPCNPRALLFPPIFQLGKLRLEAIPGTSPESPSSGEAGVFLLGLPAVHPQTPDRQPRPLRESACVYSFIRRLTGTFPGPASVTQGGKEVGRLHHKQSLGPSSKCL